MKDEVTKLEFRVVSEPRVLTPMTEFISDVRLKVDVY